MTQINFELVSPEAKRVSEPLYMAVIPGEEGVVGVLPGHASLVASLKAGVVELYETEGAEPRRIFIAGGFADVTPDNCSVLAEEAVNLADLSRDDVEQAVKRLNNDLELASEDADKARIGRRLVLAEAKLQAVAA